MSAYFASDVSLVLQIVVLALLLTGLGFRLKKMFRYHGATMLSAVVVHIATILAVMIPSFLNFAPAITLTSTISLITLIHVVAGVVALILGIWIVASWRFQQSIANCIAKKNVMRVTYTLWLIAVVLGIILYLYIAGIIFLT